MLFERCEINCDLVAGFVTAVSQFGCELFPKDELDDITFSNTHLFLQRYKVNAQDLTFMTIHTPDEDHKQITRILQRLRDELDGKYSDAFRTEVVNQKKLAPLDEFICKVFEEEKRPESPFTCMYEG